MKRATRASALALRGIRISIHALVKRATGDPLVTALYAIISIHALVKRATTATRSAEMSGRFQSTPS